MTAHTRFDNNVINPREAVQKKPSQPLNAWINHFETTIQGYDINTATAQIERVLQSIDAKD